MRPTRFVRFVAVRMAIALIDAISAALDPPAVLRRPLPPAVEPPKSEPPTICVDCDRPTAVTTNNRCTRCGSSAVFEPGARQFSADVESAVERRARYQAIVAGAMTRVARATVAAQAARDAVSTTTTESRRVN